MPFLLRNIQQNTYISNKRFHRHINIPSCHPTYRVKALKDEFLFFFFSDTNELYLLIFTASS